MIELECRECSTWTDDETAISKGLNDEKGNYICPECQGIAIVTEVEEEEACNQCGSNNILINEGSNEDEPWVIVTHYKCQKCKSYWYEED